MIMFHANIISIYGEKGKAWLNELPELVTAISARLDLRDLKKLTNLTFNYVLSGFQGNNPVILKLGLDREGLAREAFALKCFAGCGVVKVLAENDGMLLLERALPGASLRSYFPDKEQESIEIVCGVMKKLHQANISTTHNFPHIKDWLTALDNDWNIPNHYLQKAKNLRDQLLQTSKPDILLHGDLHHDNILQNGNDWVVIDPKGVIGESAYEVAAFIRNPMPELLTHADAPNIIQGRITRFAEVLEVPSQRILDWCFVQAVLAWVWVLEDLSPEALVQGDGCDTSYFEQLTRVIDELGQASD
jgi:streptomycin 6-kinase